MSPLHPWRHQRRSGRYHRAGNHSGLLPSDQVQGLDRGLGCNARADDVFLSVQYFGFGFSANVCFCPRPRPAVLECLLYRTSLQETDQTTAWIPLTSSGAPQAKSTPECPPSYLLRQLCFVPDQHWLFRRIQRRHLSVYVGRNGLLCSAHFVLSAEKNRPLYNRVRTVLVRSLGHSRKFSCHFLRGVRSNMDSVAADAKRYQGDHELRGPGGYRHHHWVSGRLAPWRPQAV